MLMPPVSFSFLTAISLECFNQLESNYLPSETHRARLAVKSHTLLHIDSILVFKKRGVSYVQKK